MFHADSSFGVGGWVLLMLAGLETACFAGMVATLLAERARKRTHPDTREVSPRFDNARACRLIGHRWQEERASATAMTVRRHCTRCNLIEIS